jgi:hypothetical protein
MHFAEVGSSISLKPLQIILVTITPDYLGTLPFRAKLLRLRLRRI